MQEEELRQTLRRFTDEKDELEIQCRKIRQEQEEEDNLIHIHYQRLENEWTDCGQQSPELGNLLEEERRVLDDFRHRKYNIEDQIQEAFRKKRLHMEHEIDELHRQLKKAAGEGREHYDAG